MSDSEDKIILDDILEKMPECDRCNDTPYFFLAVKGTLISGCEYHMLQVATKLNKMGYMNRHLAHAEVVSQEKKGN